MRISCRMQVNDQIIEVDDKSLVGVTQTYAATVLRNTSGNVRLVTTFARHFVFSIAICPSIVNVKPVNNLLTNYHTYLLTYH